MDEFHVTVDALADKLAESRASVSNYLRLLRLDSDVLALLGTGELSMGQARAIAGIRDPQRQLAVAKLAIRRNLSVRQVESLAKSGGTPQSQTRSPSGIDRHMTNLERSLTASIGYPVRLQASKRKNAGRLIISYSNLDEFDRILTRLGVSRLDE
jgi:ParB family chromosome partitioning protein